MYCAHVTFYLRCQTPWNKNVYTASVHEFMSSWLLMCGPCPMHSLMETWVLTPVWQCVCDTSHLNFCCHTLFRICTCISTWIYVYLMPTSVHHMDSYMEGWVANVKSLHDCAHSHLIFVPTPCRMCISQYMNLCPAGCLWWSTPYA